MNRETKLIRNDVLKLNKNVDFGPQRLNNRSQFGLKIVIFDRNSTFHPVINIFSRCFKVRDV